jgi:hypothetical protein
VPKIGLMLIFGRFCPRASSATLYPGERDALIGQETPPGSVQGQCFPT